MIEVILLERIERLGTLGQVVKVRPGFARNFLLPQNKALRATKANLELFEKQRAQLEAKNAELRAQAETLGKKIDGVKVVIIRQASEMGQLYGSVTARDIAEAAKEAKHPIERQMIQIDTPIKELGLFPIKVKLHPEVTVKITINVARSLEEAVIQAQKNAAVIKAAEAKAEAESEVAMVENIGKEAAPADETEESPKAKKTRAKKATGEKAEGKKEKKKAE